MPFLRRIQQVWVAMYLVALVLQFYAAGLGLFAATGFDMHAMLGYALILGALILAILTAFARMGRSAVLMAVAVLFLTVLQPVLALLMRRLAPEVAALHTVIALAIFLVTLRIAYLSRRVARP